MVGRTGLIAAGESMQQPGRYWHVNAGGSEALLVAMREAGVDRMLWYLPTDGRDSALRRLEEITGMVGAFTT